MRWADLQFIWVPEKSLSAFFFHVRERDAKIPFLIQEWKKQTLRFIVSRELQYTYTRSKLFPVYSSVKEMNLILCNFYVLV